MQKVFIVGDSISIQYGPYLEGYLQGVMNYARKSGEEEALRDLDTPMGANGGDSSMVLKYLETMASGSGIDADLLLVNCGLHDIKRSVDTNELQVPLAAYCENLSSIIKTADKMKPSLVWIRTTPCDENIHNNKNSSFLRFAKDCIEYNQAADELMAAAGIPTIDLFTFTSNLGDSIYCDHVHFHDHIREKQAAFIAGWLTR